MKKTIVLGSLLCSLATISPVTFAHHTPTHNVKATTVTVQQAKQLADDAAVKMKGSLVASLGDEKYTFKDNTGEITVEIDQEVMKKRTVDPKKVVTLIGNIDVEFENDRSKVKVDVKKIR